MKMALPLNFVGKTGPLSSELSETSVLTQKNLTGLGRVGRLQPILFKSFVFYEVFVRQTEQKSPRKMPVLPSLFEPTAKSDDSLNM